MRSLDGSQRCPPTLVRSTSPREALIRGRGLLLSDSPASGCVPSRAVSILDFVEDLVSLSTCTV